MLITYPPVFQQTTVSNSRGCVSRRHLKRSLPRVRTRLPRVRANILFSSRHFMPCFVTRGAFFINQVLCNVVSLRCGLSAHAAVGRAGCVAPTGVQAAVAGDVMLLLANMVYDDDARLHAWRFRCMLRSAGQRRKLNVCK
jgi:hypothetical protein